MEEGLFDEVNNDYINGDFMVDQWGVNLDMENDNLDSVLDKLVENLPNLPDSNWGDSLEMADVCSNNDSYIDQWFTENDQQSLSPLAVHLKSEPVSPSNNSLASSSSYQPSGTSVISSNNDIASIKLDTPPLTPPQDQNNNLHGNKQAEPSAITNGAKVGIETLRNVNNVIVVNNAPVSKLNNTPQANYNLLQPKLAASVPIHFNTNNSVKLEEELLTKPLVSIESNKLSTVELKAYKKLQRKIKNRESACLSRRKKKEYLVNLETELNKQTAISNKLRSENQLLRKKVQQLEQENIALRRYEEERKQNNFSITTKPPAVLFVVLLFIGINLTAINLMNNGSSVVVDKASYADSPSIVRGRAILSYEKLEDKTVSRNDYKSKIVTGEKDPLLSRLLAHPSRCVPSLNKTETMRISRNLQKWHQRQQVEHKHARRNTETSAKDIVKLGSTELTVQLSGKIPGKQIPTDNTQIVPYYGDYFSSVHDYVSNMFNKSLDTFYIVTFKKDLFLYPPRTRSKNQKQRLSLLMPAFNETYMTTMVKIDCEVSNTTFVKLNIPSDLTNFMFHNVPSPPVV